MCMFLGRGASLYHRISYIHPSLLKILLFCIDLCMTCYTSILSKQMLACIMVCIILQWLERIVQVVHMPRNDCSSFSVLGGGISVIAYSLLRSGFTPCYKNYLAIGKT